MPCRCSLWGEAEYSALTDIVRFGKHEGRTVAALLADRNYCRWFLAQPNLRLDQPSLFAIIANGGIAKSGVIEDRHGSDLVLEARDKALRAFAEEFRLSPLLFSWDCLFAGVYISVEGDVGDDRRSASLAVLPRTPQPHAVSALIAGTKADAIQLLGACGGLAIVSEPPDGGGFVIQIAPSAADALRTVRDGFVRKFSAVPEVARYVAAVRADSIARGAMGLLAIERNSTQETTP